MRGRGRHRRGGGGGWPAGAGLLVAVALVAVLRPGWGGSPPPPWHSGPAAAVPAASAPWAAVMAGLDAARSRAYAAAAPRGLEAVYAPGSPAGGRDRARLARLVGAGLRTSGLRVRVLQVEPVAVVRGQVSLRVVDRLDPYLVVDGRGRVVVRKPGRPERTWTVTLREVGPRWLVEDVAAST